MAEMQMHDECKVTVPPGDYILGDPCYSVPDEKWELVMDSTDAFSKPIGEVDGVQILLFGTEHGDGFYRGPRGASLGVDSGLIGLVPVDLPGRPTDADHLTARVTFTEPTLCERKKGGTLVFGRTRIRTG